MEAGTDQLPIEVLRDFTKSAPVEVRAIARELGLLIREKDMGKDSGKIEQDWAGYFVITVNERHSETRKRFTIAHEIAHYVLHRDKIGDGILDDGLYRSSKGGDIERQANNYAASILMPGPLVGSCWRNGLRTPIQLAEVFRVSPSVAEIRIRELGLKNVAA